MRDAARDWNTLPNLDRQLERDIADLNERLIDRQQTLMFQAVKLQNAERIIAKLQHA
jgi:hypothetical protein